MTYGFRSNNASGSTIISDQTYNPVFVGNATLIDYYTFSANQVKQYGQVGGPFTNPGTSGTYGRLGIANYTITLPAGTSSPLAFIKSDSNVAGGSSIASIINTSGTTWSISAWICGGVPTILVFASPQNITPNGNGMLIRKGDGSVAFNSNYQHLIPASSPLTTVPVCNLVTAGLEYYCYYYTGNSVPIPNLPASPAFLFTSPIITAARNYRMDSTFWLFFFYAGIGRISGGNFITCLGTPRISNISSGSPYDTPRNQTPIVIIDASKYY